MSTTGTPRHDPIPIGNIAEPPFARLPDPLTLFAARAERFRALAEGHTLAPFLRFLAALSDVQHRLQEGLPEPEMPAQDVVARAREHAMPPLDRSHFTADAAFDATLERLLAMSRDIEMPAVAKEALARVTGADAAARDAMVRSVLADSIPVEQLADHLVVAAALQVHFARLAARLAADKLVAVGETACPSCGGAPVSTLLVGWADAENSRFCACSLCGTMWNYIRIKCTVCGSTKRVSYQEIEGSGSGIRAETCDDCRSYVKILEQVKYRALDPLADDVASLALDLLVRELGYRRGAVNPFMLGY
jgi:FdhE protein